MRRLIAFLFSSIAFLSVAAFAQTPLPVTGNLSQILGSPQPYAGVSLQLQNCAAPITIPGTGVVVNTALQIQANASGIVNSQVWPVDIIDCNGTTGQSMYGVQYIVGGVPTADPVCYQPVSTMGVWNLSMLQPIACTQTPPNPQDGQFRNLNVTGLFSIGLIQTPIVNVKTLNSVQKADQFTGATASEQINSCLAAAGDKGTCDATGIIGIAMMDATVEVGAAGISQTLLLSSSTLFEPTVANMTIFKVDRNGQLYHTHIFIPTSLNFTGKGLDVEDSIGSGSDMNTFHVDDFYLNANGYATAGYGVYMQPPAGGFMQGAAMSNIRVLGLQYGAYLTTLSAGSYINGMMFSNWWLQNNSVPMLLNAASGSYGIQGNTFTNLHLDTSPGPDLSFTGAGAIQNNIFAPIQLWDAPTPISNTNTGCTPVTSTGAGACANLFVGSSSFQVTEPNKSDALMPFENQYYVTAQVHTGFTSLGAFSQFSVNGTRSWPGAAISAMSLGWNGTGSQGEADYYVGAYISPTDFAHLFWGPNSGNTAYVALGGFTQGGGFTLNNGNFQGNNYQLVGTGNGLLGSVTGQGLNDDGVTHGWNYAAASGSTFGHRFFIGSTQVGQLDPSGNFNIIGQYKIGGTQIAALNLSDASTIVHTGTPTVNQAACIKAVGPPVVIGTCSTVVSSSGGCTCN